MLTCTVNRQQREVLYQDRNKKLLIKETKRVGGERVLGVLVPPRDQFHKFKRVLYPLLQAPRGTREKGSKKGQRQEATEVAYEMLCLWCTSSFF